LKIVKSNTIIPKLVKASLKEDEIPVFDDEEK
jgi:hypothetical protein